MNPLQFRTVKRRIAIPPCPVKCAVALATGLALGAPNVFAQDKAVAVKSEVIVITGTKRIEAIKDVPASVSALSAGELEKQGIEGLDDLSRSVPGLAITSNGGTGLSKIQLRGISSAAGTPTVGMFLDDVPITMPNVYYSGASEPQFFDLERIEVLRGPQGTLFGASAMGGIIRFVTAQPDLKSSERFGSMEVASTRSGGISYMLRGTLNEPLSKGSSALRIGGAKIRNSGYVDVAGKKDANSDDSDVLRAALRIQPDASLSIVAGLFAQRTSAADTAVFDLGAPALTTAKLVREPRTDTMLVPSLTVNKTIDAGTFTSVTSAFERKISRTVDGTAYNSGFLSYLLSTDPALTVTYPGVDPSPIGNLPSPDYHTDTAKQITQEFRFASKGMREPGRNWQWLAGLYFTGLRYKSDDVEPIQGMNSALQKLYGVPASKILGVPSPNDLIFEQYKDNKLRQVAAFGEVGVMLTPELSLNLGLRAQRARFTDTGVDGGYFGSGIAYNISASTNSTTPKIALSYEATKDTSVYANVMKGFRLGGSNSPVSSICAADLSALGLTSAPASYQSDSLINYELGTKTKLAGGAVSLDASAYYIPWKNVQQYIYLPSCGFSFTGNAGDAESKGVEIFAKVRPTNQLTFTVAYGATHAKITRAKAGTGAAIGQNLLNTPRSTASAGAEYQFEVAGGPAFVRADYNWTGESKGSFDTSSIDYERPAYGVLGASFGMSFGSFDVTLFGKNLLNEDKVIQRPDVLSVRRGVTVRPLTIGVNVSAQF